MPTLGVGTPGKDQTVLFFEEGETGNGKVQTNVPQSRDVVV